MPAPEGKPHTVRVRVYEDPELKKARARMSKLWQLGNMHENVKLRMTECHRAKNMAAHKAWGGALVAVQEALKTFAQPFTDSPIRITEERRLYKRAGTRWSIAYETERDIEQASHAAITGHLTAKYGIVQK
jgi:hypothetical protein